MHYLYSRPKGGGVGPNKLFSVWIPAQHWLTRLLKAYTHTSQRPTQDHNSSGGSLGTPKASVLSARIVQERLSNNLVAKYCEMDRWSKW